MVELLAAARPGTRWRLGERGDVLDQVAADRQVRIVAPEDAHALGDRRPILVIAALAAGAAQAGR